MALACLCSAAALAAEKPNIVLILADDLGINDLHCYGRTEHHTPNLDRLAEEGWRFTQALTAQPLCSPSRAALMTGRSPARLGITTFLPGRADAPSQKLLQPVQPPGLPLAEVTLAELLKAQGYATACLGKWHLGGKELGPDRQGFDFAPRIPENTPPSETEAGKGEYARTAKALEFLEANRGRPFFLYLPHDNPHIPLRARPELVEKHRQAFNPHYAAMLETLDDSIGQVLAKLDELKLRENTVVIFTSDNGGLQVLESPDSPATHQPFKGGKGFVDEGGLREPLLIRWPAKLAAGRVEETPVSLGELMPTLLALAGAPVPENLDFANLAPWLLGQAPVPERTFYWHFPHYSNQGGRPAGAIRVGNWKLVEDYENGALALYDLAADPQEARDLSGPEAARVAELRGKLEAWRRAVGAKRNTPNHNFDERQWKPLYADFDAQRVPVAATAVDARELMQPWRAAMNAAAPRKNQPTPAGLVGGYFVLPAREAKITGRTLQCEPEPQKETLGRWKELADSASWQVTVPEAGKYRVEVLQACGKGSGSAQVEVSVATERLEFTVQETGHFQRFVPRVIGTVTLPAGAHELRVMAKTKPGPAVMDLRQITLTRVTD